MTDRKRRDSSPQKINLWQAFDRPPAGAEIYRLSPQIRKVPKNSTAILAITKGKKDIVFILKSLVCKHYDQIAEQDLLTGVFVGSTTQILSGKWDATAGLVEDTPYRYPWHIEETRTEAEVGKPHSLISNSTGEGYHDNGQSDFENIYLPAGKNESVYVKITNQSEFHDHAIEISFNGWLFSPSYMEVFS